MYNMYNMYNLQCIYIYIYIYTRILYILVVYVSVEGSLDVKLLTIWTDEKAEMGRFREEKKKEDQRRERVGRKKMQARGKVEKSRSTEFFPMTCGSGGSKSRLG